MTRQRAPRGRAGWTLLEVLVALLVTGIASATIHLVVRHVAMVQARLTAHALGESRDRNALRWLRSLAASVSVDGPASTFVGTPDSLRCAVRAPTPAGWFEVQELVVRMHDDRLVAELGGRRTTLYASLADATFDYLPALGDGVRWLEGWIAPSAAPYAVRVRLARAGVPLVIDTLILIIGPRG